MISLSDQQLKILRAFRSAPGRRLTSTQLNALYVLRYSARIHELRLLKFNIEKSRENSEWIYTLLSEPQEFDVDPSERDVERDDKGIAGTPVVSLSAEPETLFETAPAPANAIYGEAA